jgi:hypothetical protein
MCSTKKKKQKGRLVFACDRFMTYSPRQSMHVPLSTIIFTQPNVDRVCIHPFLFAKKKEERERTIITCPIELRTSFSTQQEVSHKYKNRSCDS